jgi:hypothetical protein
MEKNAVKISRQVERKDERFLNTVFNSVVVGLFLTLFQKNFQSGGLPV